MLKSLFSNKPFFYTTRFDYYNSITSENSFIETLFARETIQKEQSCQTSNNILFNNKLEFNSSYQEIIKEFGKPNFIITRDKKLKHTVLFYKKMIVNYRVRFELHLIDQQMIIGFKTFDITSNEDKNNIIKSILTKYDISTSESDYNKIKVLDSNLNFIKVIDISSLTLAYGSDNPIHQESLQSLLLNRKSIEVNKAKNEFKNLLDNI